ncbi:ribbon-helix-helix domain-containing protein (plasmid) [Natrinema zhouii]|uniref:ribbon-helix-helix domain-containing protein n=1 Tax=Natrinema zhouii TaxID=1710539 RepID=UPI001CFF77E8|nr:ribbon-helix-helix domain-containing protein [Natrinema zhouii]UHQ98706.1 ribbon-helix-helix domain-containing protein [Natrinema zhouii]
MSTQCETGDHDRETPATAGERVTFRDIDGQLEAIDALVESGVYANRSEAIRAALAQFVSAEPWGENDE